MGDARVIRVEEVVAGYRPAKVLPPPFAECAERLRGALSMLEGASEEVFSDAVLRRRFRQDVARSVYAAYTVLVNGETRRQV